MFLGLTVTSAMWFFSTDGFNTDCIHKAELFLREQRETIDPSEDTYSCYESLLTNGDQQVFEELGTSSNPIVQAYSFWGLYSLAEKEEEKVELLKKYISSDVTLKAKHIDVVYEATLGSLCFDLSIGSLSTSSKAEVVSHIRANKFTHIDLENIK